MLGWGLMSSPIPAQNRSIYRLYAVAVFLGAFLLFALEPMAGKALLPWFGGASAVWTTSLLFFMAMLLAGYAGAYALVRLDPRMQVLAYLSLINAALVVTVGLLFISGSLIRAGDAWKPLDSTKPIFRILVTLFFGIGLPYFTLATISTVLQQWHAAIPQKHTTTSYRLYAFSNAGSLIAIVSYPFLIEPFFTLREQETFWTAAFLLTTTAILLSARSFLRNIPEKQIIPDTIIMDNQSHVRMPLSRDYLRWISLAALPSLLLLAVTNEITQGLAAVPFLWLIPLAAYLLSFVITFSTERFYMRDVYAIFLALSSAFAALLPLDSVELSNIIVQIGGFTLSLFAAGLLCHGELYRLRPHPKHLARFYISISLGGALGGLFVAVLAPLIFKGFWELQLGLALTMAIALLIAGEKNSLLYRLIPRGQAYYAIRFFGLLFALVLIYSVSMKDNRTVHQSRNFYGTLKITRDRVGSTDNPQMITTLVNGSIVHGKQFESEPYRSQPTTYYTQSSGVGLALRFHPKRLAGEPLRVGVIGLGVGTVAAYCKPGDMFRFYEINPAVIDAAERYFSYLSQCENTEVVPGDARLSLERDLAQRGPQRFDVLIIDAFTDDSIPVHLLTKEAIMLYWANLEHEPAGIIAFHISNQYLDLEPVLVQAAGELGFSSLRINRYDPGTSSEWILFSKNASSLAHPDIQSAASTTTPQKIVRLWTDDYGNLMGVLK